MNVASYAGIITGLGDMTAASYTASKWGVVGLTRSFGDKQAKTDQKGIRGYALCPWFADTRIVTDNIEKGLPSGGGRGES